MPIKPSGSTLTFQDTSALNYTANLTIAQFGYKDVTVNFQRPEFSTERLKELKNVDGSRPVFFYLSGNRPVQYLSGCNTNETVRPFGPDTSKLNSIYNRFDIRRYEVGVLPNSAAQVANLYATARAHQILLAQFQTRQEIAKSGDIDYLYAVNTLQADNLGYLTSTNLTMSGNIVPGSSDSNLLITNFEPDVEFEEFVIGSGSVNVWLGVKMTLEHRTIVAGLAGTF